MGRIRKKTSKRGTSHNRAKISKKVAETHKKRKRDGKKDPTWKSKKKADPGIPNSFPYKDQVLAELAEEKRKGDEIKQLRKQAARAQANGDDDEDTPGIASLSNNVISRPATSSASLALPEEEEDEDVPVLVDTELGTLQDVIDRADVVLQVVDARDILGGRSEVLEGLVRDSGGRYGVIVNKIDLVPRETLQAWLPQLPSNTFLYSTTTSTPLGRSELLQTLTSWSATAIPSIPTSSTSTSTSDLTIALIGLPSTGKTSILNSLLSSTTPKKAVAPAIPAVASAKNPEPTTKAPVEVEITLVGGGTVKVIDTPGWEFVEDDEEGEMEADEAGEKIWDELEERVAGDLLRRNLGRIDRVKDVMPLVNYIFRRSNAQDLMLVYNLPTFTAGDIEAFLTSLARANGRVRKHGDPDLDSAARIILRDWAHNTFPYYCTPPKSANMDSDSDRVDMSSVLEACKGRKEMRGVGRGLVRFKSGEIDRREVILDDDYNALAGADSDEEEEDDEDAEEGDEGDEDEDEEEEEDEDDLPLIDGDEEVLELEDGSEPPSGSDIPEDEDEEDEEEEEESPPPVSALKRKRPAESPKTKAKKAKRVSFGKDVRGSGPVGGQGGGKKRKR